MLLAQDGMLSAYSPKGAQITKQRSKTTSPLERSGIGTYSFVRYSPFATHHFP
jgi:hypothetical protein